MAVKFYNDGTTYRLADKRRIAAWIKACIAHEKLQAGDITYIFCSREKHLEINRTYLGHDYATDVITFDYSDLPAGIVSGDIFIDPQTVAENAAQYGATAAQEMRRVLVHGVLHLCGYGDKTPSEQKTMRAKEDGCLALYDNEPNNPLK